MHTGLGFFPNFMLFAKTMRLHSAHIKIILSIAIDNVRNNHVEFGTSD
jgi:hypothetical protein